MEAITRYICPYCGHAFKVNATVHEEACRRKREHELNYQAIRERKDERMMELQDLVRLNATSLQDIPLSLVRYTKEVLGLDLTISRFPERLYSPDQQQSVAWKTPIDNSEKPYYFWRGEFAGRLNSQIYITRVIGDSWPSDFKFRGFRGFHTEGGNFSNEFDGTLSLFPEDFPLIWPKIHDYEVLRAKVKSYCLEVNKQNAAVRDEFDKRTKESALLKSQTDQLIALEEQLVKLRVEIGNVKDGIQTEIRAQADRLYHIDESYLFDREAYQKLKTDLGVQ